MKNKELRDNIKKLGKKYPKKHGSWYALNVFDEHYLLLDTWSGVLCHYPNGCRPSGTDNLYKCVYVFYDNDGLTGNFKEVSGVMETFWRAHVYCLNSHTDEEQ